MKKALPFILLFVAGCGASALDAAQTTVVAAHRALLEFDSEFAPLYQAARANARKESKSWEERDEKIAPWEDVRKAVTTAGLSLRTAALAIEIARDGFESDWEKRMGCVVRALLSLESTLGEIGIKVPPSISKTIRAGEIVAAPCEKWNTY